MIFLGKKSHASLDITKKLTICLIYFQFLRKSSNTVFRDFLVEIMHQYHLWARAKRLSFNCCVKLQKWTLIFTQIKQFLELQLQMGIIFGKVNKRFSIMKYKKVSNAFTKPRVIFKKESHIQVLFRNLNRNILGKVRQE